MKPDGNPFTYNLILMEAKLSLFTLEEISEHLLSKLDAWWEAKQNKKSEIKFISRSVARKLFAPEVSDATLYRWEKQNLITRHQMGGKVVYDPDEIMQAAKRLKKYKRVPG